MLTEKQKVAALVILLLLGSRLKLGWAALIPVALTLAWIDHKYVFGVYPTQYSMLFVMISLLFTLRYEASDHKRWLFLAGLSVGLVFVFKYNVGLTVAAAGVAAIAAKAIVGGTYEGQRRRPVMLGLGSIGVVLAGFAVIVGAMAAYLAYDGALGAMIDHFLHHVSAYSETRSVPLPPVKLVGPAAAVALVSVIGAFLVLRKAPRFFSVYVAGVTALATVALLVPARLYVLKISASAAVAYFPPLLLLICLGMIVWKSRRELRSDSGRAQWWSRNGSSVIVGLFALGAYLEVYPRADYYHLVRVLPPIFLFAVMLGVRWLGSDPSSTARRSVARREAMLCGAAVVVVFAVIGVKDTWLPQLDSRGRFVDRIPLSIDRARGIMVNRRQAGLIEGLTRAIEEHSAPGDPIFSFAQRGCAFYVLTGRKNPTPFVWWRAVGIKGEHRERLLAMIANRQFKLILLQDQLTDQRVRDAVGQNYHPVASVTDIAVYQRNEP